MKIFLICISVNNIKLYSNLLLYNIIIHELFYIKRECRIKLFKCKRISRKRRNLKIHLLSLFNWILIFIKIGGAVKFYPIFFTFKFRFIRLQLINFIYILNWCTIIHTWPIIYFILLYLLLLLSLSLLSRNFLYPICIFVGKRLNEERVEGETYSRPSSRCIYARRERERKAGLRWNTCSTGMWSFLLCALRSDFSYTFLSFVAVFSYASNAMHLYFYYLSLSVIFD